MIINRLLAVICWINCGLYITNDLIREIEGFDSAPLGYATVLLVAGLYLWEKE